MLLLLLLFSYQKENTYNQMIWVYYSEPGNLRRLLVLLSNHSQKERRWYQFNYSKPRTLFLVDILPGLWLTALFIKFPQTHCCLGCSLLVQKTWDLNLKNICGSRCLNEHTCLPPKTPPSPFLHLLPGGLEIN